MWVCGRRQLTGHVNKHLLQRGNVTPMIDSWPTAPYCGSGRGDGHVLNVLNGRALSGRVHGHGYAGMT